MPYLIIALSALVTALTAEFLNIGLAIIVAAVGVAIFGYSTFIYCKSSSAKPTVTSKK